MTVTTREPSTRHSGRSSPLGQKWRTGMKTTHSWKWLVPRFISHRPRSAAAGQQAIRRPCLALEGLEDRSLLSAAGTDIVIVPPTGDAAILIGLMKGTL